MRLRMAGGVVIAFILTCSLDKALALVITLPPANFQGQGIASTQSNNDCGYISTGNAEPFFVNAIGLYGDVAQGMVDIVSAPAPRLILYGEVFGNLSSQTFLSLYASESYDVEFVGPSANIPVLVTESETATTSTPADYTLSPSDSAVGQITVGTFQEQVMSNQGSPRPNGETFRGTQLINIPANTLIPVVLYANLQLTGSTFISGSVIVDPIFSISPSFADASQYQIFLSDGVGNGPDITSGVPEMSTWLMMLFGFVGLSVLCLVCCPVNSFT